MKKALIALFLLLIPVGLFAADISHVVLVSIDALHPSALTKEVSPNLWRIMQEGQYTLDGKSVTPPQTLINHSAMLTGVPPEKGGRGSYLLIVTSDHAGHEKHHGTSHPEDYRLPFILLSDIKNFPDIQGRPYGVTELRDIVNGAVE